MTNTNVRACVYPKDIQRILGKDYKTARLYLTRLKKLLNKEPHQVVSIEEFCKYSGLEKENIIFHFL